MRIRAFAAAVAVLPVALGSLAIAPPEDAPCYVVDEGDPASTEDDVQVCRADGYFTPNATRIGNLAVTDADGFPSWDDTAPTTSYQAGAGAAYVGLSPLDFIGASEFDPSSAATYEGTFTGDLDSIVVDQYLISPVDHYAYGEYYFRIRFEVDGFSLYESDFLEGSNVPFEEVSDGLGHFRIALTGIYDRVPQLRDGPDAEHDVRITITPFVPGDEAIYVFDAAEVPSGLIFNAGADALKFLPQVQPQ